MDRSFDSILRGLPLSMRQNLIWLPWAITALVSVLAFLSNLPGNFWASSILFFVYFWLLPGSLFALVIGIQRAASFVPSSLIFGLALQTLNFALFYAIKPLDAGLIFQPYLMFSSLVLNFVMLSLFSYQRRVVQAMSLRVGRRYVQNSAFAIFLLALFVRLIFGISNSGSILPDASLYADVARSSILSGDFISHVINDEIAPQIPMLATQGLIPHVFTSFAFALSFAVFGIKLSSLSYLMALVGALQVYCLYEISSRFFGEVTSAVAAIMSLGLPILLFFSSIFYGPEMLSTLFLLYAILLLLHASDENRLRFCVMSGLMIGIAENFWFPSFYAIILLIPMILAILLQEVRWVHVLIMETLYLGVAFARKTDSLSVLWSPIIIAVLLIGVLLWRSRPTKLIRYSVTVLIFLVVPLELQLVRQYLTPLQVAQVTAHEQQAGLLASLLGAFTSIASLPSYSTIQNIVFYLVFGTGILTLLLAIIAVDRGWRLVGTKIAALMISTYLIVFTLIPQNNSYPAYLFSNERLLLLPIFLTVMLASYSISTLTQKFVHQINQASWRAFSRTDLGGLGRNFLIVFILLLLVAEVAPQYAGGQVEIAQQDIQNKFGWNSVVPWIEANTRATDVILTSRPRELAWLTERTTVGIIDAVVPQSLLGLDQLDQLASTYNASYLLVDSYLYATLPNVAASFDVTQQVVINPHALVFSASFGNVTMQTHRVVTYTPLFADSEPWNPARVYRVQSTNASEAQRLLAQGLAADWVAGNNGTMVSGANGTVLQIGQHETYTYTFRRQNDLMNITSSRSQLLFFVWNLTWVNASIVRIELWDGSGIHFGNLMPPSSIGIWSSRLTATSLSDLRIVITGTSGSNVRIAWMALIELDFATG